ncbi:Polyketide cyclase / dehydrase and lipid transport [Geodermatophilus pulveris]|uniref:Polyketide cyclase / dehydrase and lipid transport n=1 Tax=Geodermatophilus pulveris TaxID=1564159 RepID=A0A239J3G7_9ACTN|nr:SRPBCC family protein [Geodermatophilus pulveris]SNT00202.1 Polyketide cyclase / dehydrase and lipid transport [Geodermatophilus pulveris]
MAGVYEDSTTIAASPQEVFAYVSDVGHLPDYLPPIQEAAERPLAEGTETDPDVQDAVGVHLVGEVKGQRFENDGWFLADADARTLRWGAQTERTYGGRLDVGEDGDGARLHVRLEFGPNSPDEEMQQQSGDRDVVHEALAATLQSVKQQLEGTGGKVLPPEPPGDVPPPSDA